MKNKKTFVLLALAFLALVSVSCRKNVPDDPLDINSTADLRVSQSFNWSTTQEIDFRIGIDNVGFLPLKSRVSLFTADPLSGAPLISSGSVSPTQAWVGKVKIPTFVKELYIKLETSTGGQFIERVSIANGHVNHTFLANSKQIIADVGLKNISDEGPDCDDCDQVISGNASVNIKNGKIYCVTDSFTGKITFETWNGGGTLKVCGHAVLSDYVELGNNCKIIVTKEGVLELNSINITGNNSSIAVYAKAKLILNNGLETKGYFENHGQIAIKGGLKLQNLSAPAINNGQIVLEDGEMEMQSAKLENNGQLLVAKSLRLNYNSGLTNNGTVKVNDKLEINGVEVNNSGDILVANGSFDINAGAKLINKGTVKVEKESINVNSSQSSENHGTIYAGKNIVLNGGSKLTNYCQMIAEKTVDLNTGFFEMINGYLKAGESITLNGGANLKISDASMVSTQKIVMNAGIFGSGDRNTVLATKTILINSSNVISGAIEAASEELIISANTPPSQHIVAGANYVTPDKMENFIPVTACNPEGVGSEGIVDTDNDGVPDDLDDFPNDPERAFRSWYPSESTFATLAYEDLWPGLGDFDFNDVVVEFQYEMITNAQNALKEMTGRFLLKAAGASLNNGFAVSMPFAPSKVGSLEGVSLAGNAITLAANGVEDGHTNETVIVVFDAIGTAYGEFLNTMPDRPYVETDLISLKMVLNNPEASFGTAPFNPFIFINQERGKEVHLIDRKPTEFVDPSYFGMWEDDSKPEQGIYYQTDKRLPWAIEIPVPFDYPVETVDILLTHLKFAAWAISSGTEFQDWYLDKPGYRNDENIYKKARK